MLQKIGNAQLNIFCTALSHNSMVSPPSHLSKLAVPCLVFLGGGLAKVRLGWVRLDYLTYMIFLGANVKFARADLVCKLIFVSNPSTVEVEVILWLSWGCDCMQNYENGHK